MDIKKKKKVPFGEQEPNHQPSKSTPNKVRSSTSPLVPFNPHIFNNPSLKTRLP